MSPIFSLKEFNDFTIHEHIVIDEYRANGCISELMSTVTKALLEAVIKKAVSHEDYTMHGQRLVAIHASAVVLTPKQLQEICVRYYMRGRNDFDRWLNLTPTASASQDCVGAPQQGSQEP